MLRTLHGERFPQFMTLSKSAAQNYTIKLGSILGIILSLTICLSTSYAQWLLCPYDTELIGPQTFARSLTLNREPILAALKAELQGPHNRLWRYPGIQNNFSELEVSYSPTENRALLHMPYTSLSQATQDLIFGTTEGNCLALTLDEVPLRRKLARAARLAADGQSQTFDGTDPTRTPIHPEEHQATLWTPARWFAALLWQRLLPALRVPVAYALGIFPDGVVIDTMTYTNGTIPAPWALLNTNTTALAITSNVAGCPGSVCDMYDPVRPMANDADAFLTYPTLTSTSVWIGCRMQNPGADTQDGYMVNLAAASGGVVRLWRITDNGFVQQGTSVTQTRGAGDKLGIRCAGTTISSYYMDVSVAATWNLIDTQGSQTLYTSGAVGLHCSDADCQIDDVGWTQPVTRRPSPVGLRYVR